MNDQLRTGPGVAVTKGFEKCVLHAYKPTPNDRWTIGYGATFHSDGTPVQERDVFTQAQANAQLDFDLMKFEGIVRHKISIPLKQHEFDALVDFAFNTGGGYRDHNGNYHDYDLWHNINNGMSGQDLVNYWMGCAITQAGIKLSGLIRRRRSEICLFTTGQVNTFE